MEIKLKNLWGIVFAIVLLIGGFFVFGYGKTFYFVVVVAFVVGGLPFIISLVVEQSKQREKEERFLEFTRDLVENVRSGTPVSRGIINLRNRDYGALSEHVLKLANQLAMGLTLSVALRTFAKDSGSKVISRATGLISEAERAGGQIETIIESVSKSVNQSENLKKEQKSAVSNLVVQGYIIFLVFIIIMLVLELKILPMTAGIANVDSGLNLGTSNVDPDSFSLPLLVMLLVQSAFAGLVIGKISEGSLKEGIKHSFILVALTLVITTGIKALFGG